MSAAIASPPADLASSPETRSRAFLIDLVVYLAVMFLIREVYFESAGFITNGLFWSFTTLAVATWRIKARGVTWAELGLRKPKSAKGVLGTTVFILVLAVCTIVAFQTFKDQFGLDVAADTSSESAASKFGQLKDNWPLFFSILPAIWLESMLEEVLDRGFMMNWIERVFSSTRWATVLAVILQAAIFGFRHSNDISERSITVGLLGLAMGVGYVLFGRNLWPLILAHCALNTMSMMDRVG